MRSDERRDQARSPALSFWSPLHAMLAAFPLVCFVGAFLTDLAYAGSANLQWQYFSVWLLTAGLVVGALAAVAGIVDYAVDRQRARGRQARWHIVLNSVAWLLSLVNAFVHSRDGWIAVVPQGLILSGIVALLVLAGFWQAQTLLHRRHAGVGA